VQYSWSDGRVIGTFCAFGGLVVIFGLYEYYLAGKTKLFPYQYFAHRTQAGASGMAFFLFFSMLVGIYYLPIFVSFHAIISLQPSDMVRERLISYVSTLQYEATKGRSASKAGIDVSRTSLLTPAIDHIAYH
jgi:hypothetical protein